MEVKKLILLVLSLMFNISLLESSSSSFLGDCIVRDCPSGYYFSFITCGCKIWESLSIPTLFPSTSRYHLSSESPSSEEESPSEAPSSSDISSSETQSTSPEQTFESPSSSGNPSCAIQCDDPLVQDQISCLCTIPSPSSSQTGYEPTTEEFSSSFTSETPSSATPSKVCLNSCGSNFEMNLNTCECVCVRQNCPTGYIFDIRLCNCVRRTTPIPTYSDTSSGFLTSSPDTSSDTPTPSETPSPTPTGCYPSCPPNYSHGRGCECYCNVECSFPFVADYDNCKCKCDPNIQCPSGCGLDSNLCLCFPPSCPQNFIQDPETNECICDQNYHLNCSYNQKWDNQTCHCACPKSEICSSGYVFDQTLCACICEPKICENNFKHNQNNCECECDVSAVNKSCPSGFIFSYVTCQCEVKMGVNHPSGC